MNTLNCDFSSVCENKNTKHVIYFLVEHYAHLFP